MKIAAMGLGFVLNVLLARLLQPAWFGVYSFAFTVATLLSMPLRSGVGTLMVREAAVYCAGREWSRLNGLLRAANISVLAVTLVTASILLWLSSEDRLEGGHWTWVAVLVPLYALGGLRGAALRGLGRPVLGQLPEYILRPLFFISLIGVAGFFKWRMDVAGAMALHAWAMAFAFLVGTVLLWRALPPGMNDSGASYDLRHWARAVVPFTLLASMQVIQGSLDVLMLGFLSDDVQVGHFRAGEQFASLVGVPALAASMVLAPELARMFSAGNRARMQDVATKATRANAALALPLALVFILAGGLILRLSYGAAYEPAWPILMVLSLTALISAAFGPVGLLLNMSGFERETVRSISASLLLNAALNVILVPRYGALGAAVATAAGTVFWNVFLTWRIKRLIGISITVFSFPDRSK